MLRGGAWGARGGNGKIAAILGGRYSLSQRMCYLLLTPPFLLLLPHRYLELVNACRFLLPWYARRPVVVSHWRRITACCRYSCRRRQGRYHHPMHILSEVPLRLGHDQPRRASGTFRLCARYTPRRGIDIHPTNVCVERTSSGHATVCSDGSFRYLGKLILKGRDVGRKKSEFRCAWVSIAHEGTG